MARKAQMHEPLAVQAEGGVFEKCDAALVGCDQVVVGRENAFYDVLNMSGRDSNLQSVDMIAIQSRVGIADVQMPEVKEMQVVIYKPRVVSIEFLTP